MTGQLLPSPVVFWLLAKHRVAVADGSLSTRRPRPGKTVKEISDVRSAGTVFSGMQAPTLKGLDGLERTRTIRRTAAKKTIMRDGPQRFIAGRPSKTASAQRRPCSSLEPAAPECFSSTNNGGPLRTELHGRRLRPYSLIAPCSGASTQRDNGGMRFMRQGQTTKYRSHPKEGDREENQERSRQTVSHRHLRPRNRPRPCRRRHAPSTLGLTAARSPLLWIAHLNRARHAKWSASLDSGSAKSIPRIFWARWIRVAMVLRWRLRAAAVATMFDSWSR